MEAHIITFFFTHDARAYDV